DIGSYRQELVEEFQLCSNVLRQEGEYRKLTEMMQPAMDVGLTELSVHLSIAISYEAILALNKEEISEQMALSRLKKALSVDPTNAHARENMEQIKNSLETRRDWEQVMKYLELGQREEAFGIVRRSQSEALKGFVLDLIYRQMVQAYEEYQDIPYHKRIPQEAFAEKIIIPMLEEAQRIDSTHPTFFDIVRFLKENR
ncbi:MAG: hypothetical protein QGI86_27760, partial [Candidatus Poribacteria bacterium]|nr:hypothetical protein [Candidatus Poribacteria bacterium]